MGILPILGNASKVPTPPKGLKKCTPSDGIEVKPRCLKSGHHSKSAPQDPGLGFRVLGFRVEGLWFMVSLY